MPTWDPRANELFLAALDLPAADRSAFLDAACADPVVRARVEAMLSAEGPARDFLRQPAVAVGRPAPDRLGPYKLLQKIGEGGMGAVWMAEQSEPVRRTVAVKVIRGGDDSARITARFEAERQALAMMDHPNIAKVHDAGTAPDGRPFFVMELVKGVPITTFCDDRRLTVRERLGLFVSVCRAVQHAHQKGVIHRDLKPGNILVALYDGRPVPKVIDFGVAKATGSRLTDKTLFTEFGTVIGTIEYMSPEQAELNQLDVDTRTDVYSLGVILYELLTGTIPLERDRLRSVPLLEVLRQVREGETPRPSTRLSTAVALPTIAAARGIDPRRLSGLLRGELDWIAMTALEKDRERRYESAAALAADVERYLRDDPVQACPPSVGYRVRKFARRHRRGLVVAGAVGLVLVLAVGAAAGAIGWAIRDVESRRLRAADEARAAAARELDRADLLLAGRKRPDAEAAWERAAHHAATAGTDDALAARLAEARGRLDAAARDDEFVAGYEDVMFGVGTEADQSGSLIGLRTQDAVARLRGHLAAYGLGTDVPPAVAAARILGRPAAVRESVLAAIYECDLRGRDKSAPDVAAARWFDEVLDRADPDPWRAAVRAAWDRGDGAALDRLVREVDPRAHHTTVLMAAGARAYPHAPDAALEYLRRVQAAHPGDVRVNRELGALLVRHRAPAEGVRYLTAALALRPGNPALLLYRATALDRGGEPNAALADAAEAVRIAPGYAVAHSTQARLWNKKQDWDAAEAAARRAIALRPDLAAAHVQLGNALRGRGDTNGALAAFRAATAADAGYADGQLGIGIVLRDRGDIDGALAAFRAAAAADLRHAASRHQLGTTLWAHKKDAAGGTAALREALAIDPHAVETRVQLGRMLLAAKDYDGAIAEAGRVVAARPASGPAHEELGTALKEAGKLDDAIESLRRAAALDPGHTLAWNNLGVALLTKNDARAAADALRRAVGLDPKDAQAWNNLGAALLELKDVGGAVEAFRSATAAGPAVAEYHFHLGLALDRKGDFAGALAATREAARLDPKHPDAVANCAKLCARLGRWRDARDHWSEAARLFPDDPNGHYRLAVVLTVGPDPDLYDPGPAAASARRLIALKQPTHGWMLLGWAQYRGGDWKAAVESAEKSIALAKPPKDVTPLRGYLMAVAHARLGNTAEARQWYDRAVAAGDDPVGAETTRRVRAEAAALLGLDPPMKK